MGITLHMPSRIFLGLRAVACYSNSALGPLATARCSSSSPHTAAEMEYTQNLFGQARPYLPRWPAKGRILSGDVQKSTDDREGCLRGDQWSQFHDPSI